MTKKEKWDRRFLQLAELISGWAKDPSTQCGAVIVREDKTIASLGYNGYPKGCNDSNYDDREYKYARVVHAELNAILNASENLEGYTIYVTHPTCSQCAAAIIQSGIKTVVYNYSEELLTRWGKSIESGKQMFDEAGVEFLEVDNGS